MAFAHNWGANSIRDHTWWGISWDTPSISSRIKTVYSKSVNFIETGVAEHSCCRRYYFCLSQREPVQRNFLSVTQTRAEAQPGCAGYLSRRRRASATSGSDLYRSLGFNDKYKVLHLFRSVTEEIKSLTRSPWKAICTAITKHRCLSRREPVGFRGLIYNLLEAGH